MCLMNESLERILQEITLDPLELAPGKRATMLFPGPGSFPDRVRSRGAYGDVY